MIIRIVEIDIQKGKMQLASELLADVAPKVRAMAGCSHLHILADLNKSTHITTYSYWHSEADLNAYRHSTTFKAFWEQIKPLFASPAKAWSSESLHYLP